MPEGTRSIERLLKAACLPAERADGEPYDVLPVAAVIRLADETGLAAREVGPSAESVGRVADLAGRAGDAPPGKEKGPARESRTGPGVGVKERQGSASAM